MRGFPVAFEVSDAWLVRVVARHSLGIVLGRCCGVASRRVSQPILLCSNAMLACLRHTAALVRKSLKVDIDKGLADLTEGHVKDFDVAGIIERGRKLLATPLGSAG